MASFQRCPREHYWKYEVGLRSDRHAPALTFGSAWASAMESRWKGKSFKVAAANAIAGQKMERIPETIFSSLLMAYYAHWGNKEVRTKIHPEQEFKGPLNGVPGWTVAGKLDGLGTQNAEHVIVEGKTTASKIDSGSDYWMRLRFNPQLLQYYVAAMAAGWNIAKVIYDVVRKPKLKQKLKGKVPETLYDFGERVFESIQSKPEFYFARREVTVLQDDVDAFLAHRNNIAFNIMHFRKREKLFRLPEEAHVRAVGTNTCRNCQFQSFCLQNRTVNPKRPPAGFRVGAFNPELNEATPEIQD